VNRLKDPNYCTDHQTLGRTLGGRREALAVRRNNWADWGTNWEGLDVI
jgi:hypothetical protein